MLRKIQNQIQSWTKKPKWMTSGNWFRPMMPISSRESRILFVLAFIFPLLIWSAVSYIPVFWHPLMEITNPGDTEVEGDYSYLDSGMLVEKEVYTKRNQELSQAGATLAEGVPSNPIYLPDPHEVITAMFTAFKTEPKRRGDSWLHESLAHSFKIIFLGFFWAVIFGVPIGILCGTFTPISRLVEPFVDFVRYMPAPVFGALAVAILGLADGPKITIIFIGTFFQMVLIVANTTRGFDRSLLQAAETLGASGLQLLFKVIIPGSMSGLYRDMRVLLGWAWTYLVVAELVGAKSGISAFLYQSQRYKQFDNVYASILLIGLIGLVTDQVLSFLGNYLFPWESGKKSLGARLRKFRNWFSSPYVFGAERPA